MAALNPAARNALLQAANQSQMSRQLEMLQQRGGQYHFPNRPAQSIGVNGAPQPGQIPNNPSEATFSSPAGPSDPLKNSPAMLPVQQLQPPQGVPPTGQSLQPNMQGMPAGRRPMTYNELKERHSQIKEVLGQLEGAATQLSGQRNSMPESVFMPKMQMILKEIQTKREYLAKVTQAMQMNTTGFSAGQPSNMLVAKTSILHT